MYSKKIIKPNQVHDLSHEFHMLNRLTCFFIEKKRGHLNIF